MNLIGSNKWNYWTSEPNNWISFASLRSLPDLRGSETLQLIVDLQKFECDFSHLGVLISKYFSCDGGQLAWNFSQFRVPMFKNVSNHGR